MLIDLSSSREGWEDKNFWVRGNFDPFSSIAGAHGIRMNYNVLGEFLTYNFLLLLFLSSLLFLLF